MKNPSPGARFRKALKSHAPLQIVGTINAYCAMLAEDAGHNAIYLSGGGVANASYGFPDLGITSLNDVIIDVERICNASYALAPVCRFLSISIPVGEVPLTSHALSRLWRGPAPRLCILRIKFLRSAVVIAPTKQLLAQKRW